MLPVYLIRMYICRDFVKIRIFFQKDIPDGQRYIFFTNQTLFFIKQCMYYTPGIKHTLWTYFNHRMYLRSMWIWTLLCAIPNSLTVSQMEISPSTIFELINSIHDQASNKNWTKGRTCVLNASNFGAICKIKEEKKHAPRKFSQSTLWIK